jgi:hypothetical protein
MCGARFFDRLRGGGRAGTKCPSPRPSQPVNLSQFGIVLTVPQIFQRMVLQNSLYWFPDVVVAPPAWIFLYTGAGQDQVARNQGSGEPAHVLHWGNPQTLFARPNLFGSIGGAEPTLIRVAAIAIGQVFGDG